MLKSKNPSEVEVVIKELVKHIERKMKYKVERIHADSDKELQTKSLKARCVNRSIRRTSSTPGVAKQKIRKKMTRVTQQEPQDEEEQIDEISSF